MRKHGDSVVADILEDVAELDNITSRERHWIKKYRDEGYDLLNHTDGGEGCLGYRHSDEAKKLMSETRLGRKHSDSTKALMSCIRKGVPLSAEARANISKAQIGKVISEETRAKISASKQGTRMSEETRAKMQKWWAAEKSYAGVPLSEEHRKKLSEAAKGRKASAETRQRMSDQRRGVPKPPEQKHQQYHVSRGFSSPKTCKFCKEERDTNDS